MRRLPSVLILILSSALGVACASIFANVGTKRVIKIPHGRHLKAEVDCLTCHESIFDSETLATQDLPEEKTCLQCHRKQKDSGNCAFCHIGEPTTYVKKERFLIFNHSKHLENDEDCRKCHQTLPEPGSTESTTPPMSACTSCHNHQQDFQNGKCNLCHIDLQRYPLKPITEFSHEGDFLKRHGAEARAASSSCATCHQQSFCADCHAQTVPTKISTLMPERVDRSFIHRADFFSRHPVEAQANPAMCMKCHSENSCETCHTERGVSAFSDPTRNPHPDGYGMKHGQDARNNITSCAVCHDRGAQSICVDCHRVGGVGGNPHPQSWLARHRHQEINTNATCMVCHQ